MSFNLAMFLSKSAPGVGVLGAVVGGSAALAKNLKAKSEGEITTREVVVDTSKETAGAGVATAFSAYVTGVVGASLIPSLGTAFVTAVVGKYAWDRGVELVEDRIQGREALSDETVLVAEPPPPPASQDTNPVDQQRQQALIERSGSDLVASETVEEAVEEVVEEAVAEIAVEAAEEGVAEIAVEAVEEMVEEMVDDMLEQTEENPEGKTKNT
ncbi:MAG: magnetosome protein MamC [Magnetococcales bacterium]|nr:magnetosome protein MamC [Magnetococcales bacterium]